MSSAGVRVDLKPCLYLGGWCEQCRVQVDLKPCLYLGGWCEQCRGAGGSETLLVSRRLV